MNPAAIANFVDVQIKGPEAPMPVKSTMAPAMSLELASEALRRNAIAAPDRVTWEDDDSSEGVGGAGRSGAVPTPSSLSVSFHSIPYPSQA